MRHDAVVRFLVVCVVAVPLTTIDAISPMAAVGSAVAQSADRTAYVDGEGDTYQEAYNSARAKLPSGKSHYKIEDNRRNGKYYIRLWYYVD